VPSRTAEPTYQMLRREVESDEAFRAAIGSRRFFHAVSQSKRDVYNVTIDGASVPRSRVYAWACRGWVVRLGGDRDGNAFWKVTR